MDPRSKLVFNAGCKPQVTLFMVALSDKSCQTKAPLSTVSPSESPRHNATMTGWLNFLPSALVWSLGIRALPLRESSKPHLHPKKPSTWDWSSCGLKSLLVHVLCFEACAFVPAGRQSVSMSKGRSQEDKTAESPDLESSARVPEEKPQAHVYHGEILCAGRHICLPYAREKEKYLSYKQIRWIILR